jgi:phosphohistidine swiveling domain-containing protein
MKFSTKANNLKHLEENLKSAKVLPQYRVSYSSWVEQPETLLSSFFDHVSWSNDKVIVRSTSSKEDCTQQSLAGFFESVLNVKGVRELRSAINTVFKSYGQPDGHDEVFIQPMVKNVKLSGVVFTKDPANNTPYFVINYSTSKETDVITGGASNANVSYISKGHTPNEPTWQNKICSLCRELETYFKNDSLDIEFAIDTDDNLILLQVRPLIINSDAGPSIAEHYKLLKQLNSSIANFLKPHPYLNGQRSLLGVMPDWNPAEIIGIRPRPLALSLYKELVTDSTWAYQRNNYGYKQLRSFPLLLSLHGLPYIDVRVSFNSFIPKEIPNDLAEKLVNYYLDELERAPEKHDKVEFDIIFSCYTLDIEERVKRLSNKGFSDEEIATLLTSLRALTNNIIKPDGLWYKDIDKVSALPHRRDVINNSNLPIKDKIYWLLEDCKRYGTLPFAGLARAGFIAVQFLRSMVATQIISEKDYHTYLASIETVSSNLKQDFSNLSISGFLRKYGHLRPGTYDILSPRYDKAPDKYFEKAKVNSIPVQDYTPFTLSLEQLSKLKNLLESNGIEHDVISIFSFIKGAIEGREYAKFIFTQSLSDALELIGELGNELDLSHEEISFANISVILDAYSNSEELKPKLTSSIETGKRLFKNTQQITLPPLISQPNDVYSFTMPEGEPNYITQQKVTAPIIINPSDASSLERKIVFIPSADPGFDWLFSHNIAGLVTKYGGCNSHMAIRAGELNIPSVIGAGEVLYEKWCQSNTILIDACNRKVTIIK